MTAELLVLLAVGLGPELANGTNRVAVLAGAMAAMVSFARNGRIQWPIVSPTRLQLAIVGALLVALALLAVRPAR